MEAEPKLYRAIMVSSTFTDLEAHRREVIDAIHRFGFHAVELIWNITGHADPHLSVRGARERSQKSVDVDIPRETPW